MAIAWNFAQPSLNSNGPKRNSARREKPALSRPTAKAAVAGNHLIMQGRVIEWDRHMHLASVDSTNIYARHKDVPPGSWVTASEQTQGRGRGQHSWTAIGAERLIFSAKVALDNKPTAALPVRIGGAVLRACRAACGMAAGELQLKWPNDIFRRDKKVGGILVEAENGEPHLLIVGVGINIYGKEVPPGLPDAGYLCDGPPGLTVQSLARAIIAEINIVLNDASDPDASQAELQWISKNSYLEGKLIRASSGENQVEGRVQGLSADGYLRLVGTDGSEMLLSDAATEIRITKH